jgi:FKBP-type peptidyl-prolyl cis-trans isomerase SlyD
MKVRANTLVTIHYRLFDATGELVESTEDDGPVCYLHGNEEILTGLEGGLEGSEAGQTLRLVLAPADAYGEYDPEGLVSIPRTELPSDVDYEAGDWISVSVDGEEEEGEAGDKEDGENEMEMRVLEVRADEIVLDANHPLAGQSVTFEVEVLAVEPPEE